MLYNQSWDRKNEVADLLNSAADVISEKGYARHILHDDNTGSMCLQGAMIAAHHPQGVLGQNEMYRYAFGDEMSEIYKKAISTLARTISWDGSFDRESYIDHVCTIVHWNNNVIPQISNQTGQEPKEIASEKLREAAKIAEEIYA